MSTGNRVRPERVVTGSEFARASRLVVGAHAGLSSSSAVRDAGPGIVMIDAWKALECPRYLDAARRAGDTLLEAQLGSGGWASELPVRGASMPVWFRWLNHETALDDDVTSGASRFLLALWRATGDGRYRDGARRGLDLVRAAQLANGAWPLTWRPGWLRWLSPSFEDWPRP